jgi:hypothetical protein
LPNLNGVQSDSLSFFLLLFIEAVSDLLGGFLNFNGDVCVGKAVPDLLGGRIHHNIAKMA